MEDERKQFEINFSSYQLIGNDNLESKSRLQIEIYDSKNQIIVARSHTFLLKDLVKTITNQESSRRTTLTNLNIKMNNLASNTMSKFSLLKSSNQHGRQRLLQIFRFHSCGVQKSRINVCVQSSQPERNENNPFLRFGLLSSKPDIRWWYLSPPDQRG